MIGGPSSNMGEQNVPFTFNATLDVSGLDSITGIHVRAWVDSHLVYDQVKNQGDTVTFEVDTRTMATGAHAIRVTAEHDTVLPAKADYTFTITGDEVPEGGRSVQAEDELGNPIWFRVMGRDVIANGNESIMNEIEDLRTQHFGATGRLEHVDTVSGVSSYTLTREVGVTYGVTLYPQIAAGTTTPMLRFSIPNGYTGNVTLGRSVYFEIRYGYSCRIKRQIFMRLDTVMVSSLFFMFFEYTLRARSTPSPRILSTLLVTSVTASVTISAFPTALRARVMK